MKRALGMFCALVLASSTARASEPEYATGVVREEEQPADSARRLANVVLWGPRKLVELFFLATGATAGLIDEEQVVPRVRDLLNPPSGEVRVFPTAFVETGSSFNVGGRMIARAGGLATTVRAGVGGRDDLVAESRLRFAWPAPLPLSLSLDALHDSRSSVGYLGLGQNPESDPRNAFLPGVDRSAASYLERRERFIAGAGARPIPDVEALVSLSLSRRQARDPKDATSIDGVFVPGSVPGFDQVTRTVYGEFALRLDTRQTRGGPDTGVLFELYAGRGFGVGATDTAFARRGGRGAAFIGVGDRSNVLSPKLVIDTLDPQDDGRVPFVELPRQPDFRGFDNRRDFVSVVGSLDYRWTLMRYLAARLFVDAATVAPRLDELELDLRPAGGFGFDVFSSSTQLGSLALAVSPDGVRFLLSIGVGSSFGDRQHRN
jgi:hypothetical protein